MTDLEKSYVKLSPIEHVLKKPGMYVGDLDFREEKQFIYKKNSIIYEKISWSPGLYKIVDELIVNAYDQSIRDKTLSEIKINITENDFTIYNDGLGIDVALHPIHKIYIPELIFANLLTSTNYDDTEERVTGGTHGLGAKLSAIFSKEFLLEVWDKKRELYYSQTFSDNLSKISKPKIVKNKNEGGVKITIKPDFEKFKTNKFSNDMILLLKRRAIDLIGLVRKDVTIYLQDTKLDDSDFTNYLKYYESNEEYWFNTKCIKNDLWRIALRFNNNKSIDSGIHISFVNGINTNRGGKHVDYILDMLLEKLQKIVSKDLTKKLLNDYLTLCIKVSIINPTFNSQTKEELNTPPSKFGFTCSIPDSFFKELKESDIIDKLKQVISLSNQKILSKFDGSKKSKIKNLPKLEDANYAGTKKSIQCTLILTEGDSAKATAISGISALKDGRNIFGVYPLRGKLLNVREASTSQINSNQEISDIKKILGLKSNFNYTKDNINELRYGSIMIMTDADEDGSHIKGLILNFIDYFFPSLLEIEGFIKILVTPLVKATYNNETLDFSNLRSYKNWLLNNKNKNWKVKYYKGLGTSTSLEAGTYFKNLEKNTISVLNKNNRDDILLAFAKDKVNDRKSWLNKYDPNIILELEPPQTITIKQFVNQELIHFSNYDNIRSIPSLSDGLKPSQRKVLYGCFKRNLVNEMKIAQLAAYIAEVSAYHHGEQSLVGTVINMAQNFVGSNNLNLLVPQGQLGTRLMGGKDHSSARYIFTYLEKYTNKIFIKQDLELLEYLDDDGTEIEPKFYLPIIPMVLVNGSEGIGTGFSTYIPNYNAKDIIKYLMNKLNNIKNKDKLIPYYKNFKGSIIELDDLTFISSGNIELLDNKNELIITELPVKLWTNDYKEFLEMLIYEDKDKLFKSYSNMSSDVEVKFVLTFNPENKDKIKNMLDTVDANNLNNLYKYLHLYKTLKQSNMNLYSMDYKIQSFNNAEEIIDTFYEWRLTYYDKRKELLLGKLKEETSYISNQIKFIELVIKDNGKIFKLEDDAIDKYLQTNKITKVDNSYDYLLNMTFKQLTKISLERLEKKLKEIKNEYKNLDLLNNKQLWLQDLNDLLNFI